MLVYHRTRYADAIAHLGFRDGYKIAVAPDEPAGMLEFYGVWVSADFPLNENEGARGEAVFRLDIPDELFTEYEWVEEGLGYREAMIPAAKLNRHRGTLRRLTDEELEAIPDPRFESFGH
jgi:hypothetical protein